MATITMPVINAIPTVRFFPAGVHLARIAPVRTFQLGEVLVRQGLVSKSQLQRALQIQASEHHNRQMLGEILIAESVVTLQELKTALREQFWRNNGFWVID